jgi:hypothetical protein
MYHRINSALWDDPWFQELQPIKKCLVLYFLTCEHTTINGRYISQNEIISLETGISEKIMKKSIRDLCTEKKLFISGDEFTVSKTLMKFIWWQHGPKGADSGRWKGGITPINVKIRTSKEYKEWRKEVFCRDKYTCQTVKIVIRISIKE